MTPWMFPCTGIGAGSLTHHGRCEVRGLLEISHKWPFRVPTGQADRGKGAAPERTIAGRTTDTEIGDAELGGHRVWLLLCARRRVLGQRHEAVPVGAAGPHELCGSARGVDPVAPVDL